MAVSPALDIEVLPGQVYRVGPHLIACGDLKYDIAIKLIEYAGEQPTMMYADLPWTPGVASSFRRQSEFTKGDRFSFKELVTAVMRTAARTTGCGFIETGILEEPWKFFQDGLAETGLTILGEWTTKWNQIPGVLVRVKNGGEPHEHPHLPPGELSGKSQRGRNWIADAVILDCTKPGDLVIDPVMGFGAIAMAAIATGRRALGTELVPSRTLGCLHRLTGATGERAELVANLLS